MAACASCGQVNPEIARFCLACGAPIEQEARPSAEERKTVTVLFCDLVGFTAASDHADPEDVRARIRPYHARLRREVQGFAGTVEKFIGDAVMAVFGAPVAHEDDPERAVRAGLRILEAIADLNEADPGLGLAVRVGVESRGGGGRARRAPGAGRRHGHRGCGEHSLAAAGRGAGGRGARRPEDLRRDPGGVRLPGAGPGEAEGQGRAGAGVPGAGAAGAAGHRCDPVAFHAAGGPADRPGHCHRGVSEGGAGIGGAPGGGGRGAGGGQVAAGGRAAVVRRWLAGAGPLAPGPVPALWGGDHVLGAGGDRQGRSRASWKTTRRRRPPRRSMP